MFRARVALCIHSMGRKCPLHGEKWKRSGSQHQQNESVCAIGELPQPQANTQNTYLNINTPSFNGCCKITKLSQFGEGIPWSRSHLSTTTVKFGLFRDFGVLGGGGAKPQNTKNSRVCLFFCCCCFWFCLGGFLDSFVTPPPHTHTHHAWTWKYTCKLSYDIPPPFTRTPFLGRRGGGGMLVFYLSRPPNT